MAGREGRGACARVCVKLFCKMVEVASVCVKLFCKMVEVASVCVCVCVCERERERERERGLCVRAADGGEG